MVTDITIKKGYKQTEVGVIPVDWEVNNLGNFVQIRSGESPSKFKISKSGVPYFKVDQLNNSIKYQKETPYFIDVTNPVKAKSLVFPKRGAAIYQNKIRILAQDSYMDTNLMTLTVGPKLDHEYLFYYLMKRGLSHIADTTSVPQLNNKHINPFKIIYPKSKLEQTVIATVLSDTDALIEKLEKLIAKKKAIKQGTMQQLLTGKKRLPGFSGGWKTETIGKIVEIRKGELITELTRIPGNIPVIAGGKTPAYYHNRPNRTKKTITISGSGANAGYVSLHTKPIFASDCSTIEEHHSYSIEYLYFRLLLIQEKIYTMQTGGAQPHIHPSDISPLVIELPKDLNEQSAIAQVLSDMDIEINNLDQQRDKCKMIKEGLMQQLLTGKIRIYANN